MQLYDPSDNSGLFNLWGKLFALSAAVDAARGGGVQAKRDAIQQVLNLAPECQAALSGHATWLMAGNACLDRITAAALALLARYLQEKSIPYRSPTPALEELLRDLVDGGYYFSASSRSLTVTAASTNHGDAVLAVSDRNGRGEPVWVYPEVLEAQRQGGNILIKGDLALRRGDRQWPGGSFARVQVPAAGRGNSLLANPGWELVTATDTPSDWVIHTGTPGTTILILEPEEQQIAITGGPTGGYFVLAWQDLQGQTWQTAAIGHAPTADEIQAALRAISGLGQVTVSGSNPFTVTFEDTPGDIAELVAISRLTGGTAPSVQVTTSRPGDSLAYRGRALKLVGDGVESTTLYQAVRLEAGRVYFLIGRARRTATATGEIRFELRRSISEAVLSDSSGHPNQVVLTVAGLPTASHGTFSGTFRLPVDYGDPSVLMVIRVATPIPAGQAVGLDELLLIPGLRLYPGGPWVAAGEGRLAGEGDGWTITATNDLAGRWETVLERFFHFRERLDREVPAAGTNLIPDSLLD